MRAVLTLLFLWSLWLPSAAVAQTAPNTQSPAGAQSTATPAPRPITAYTLLPDKLQKSKALYDLEGYLRIVGTVWSFVVILAILHLGVGARYRIWAGKSARFSYPQALIVVPLLLLTLDVPDLPLQIYSHSVSLRFGLSVQGWASWFGDVGKGELLGMIFWINALWLLIFLIRKSPTRWWFYYWLIALPFIFIFAVIVPFLIEPMFFKFEPLDKNHPQLVNAIETVTQRGGLSIPRDRMFEMKASEKVTTLNAYVTGLGPSKRVVVWDTTIEKSSTPEILFVFGHEMGHYVLHHVLIGLIAGAIGLLIGLYLLYRLSGWFLHRFGARWKIPALGDWAALPMIFLIFAILSFFATPIANTISRQIEHDADVYGLEVTHGINANSSEVAAHAFQLLGELSLDYPYPNKLVVFWYYSHPDTSSRVRFAHDYDPWSKGQSPRYVK